MRLTSFVLLAVLAGCRSVEPDLDADWELDGFRLGMTFEEVVANLGQSHLVGPLDQGSDWWMFEVRSGEPQSQPEGIKTGPLQLTFSGPKLTRATLTDMSFDVEIL